MCACHHSWPHCRAPVGVSVGVSSRNTKIDSKQSAAFSAMLFMMRCWQHEISPEKPQQYPQSAFRSAAKTTDCHRLWISWLLLLCSTDDVTLTFMICIQDHVMLPGNSGDLGFVLTGDCHCGNFQSWTLNICLRLRWRSTSLQVIFTGIRPHEATDWHLTLVAAWRATNQRLWLVRPCEAFIIKCWRWIINIQCFHACRLT